MGVLTLSRIFDQPEGQLWVFWEEAPYAHPLPGAVLLHQNHLRNAIIERPKVKLADSLRSPLFPLRPASWPLETITIGSASTGPPLRDRAREAPCPRARRASGSTLLCSVRYMGGAWHAPGTRGVRGGFDPCKRSTNRQDWRLPPEPGAERRATVAQRRPEGRGPWKGHVKGAGTERARVRIV